MGNRQGWDNDVNLDLDRIGNNYQVYLYFVIWIYSIDLGPTYP